MSSADELACKACAELCKAAAVVVSSDGKVGFVCPPAFSDAVRLAVAAIVMRSDDAMDVNRI